MSPMVELSSRWLLYALALGLGLLLLALATLAWFVAAVLPGQVSGSASALLQAFERMELPAAVTVLSSALRILLSLVVLAAGASIVALGAVSLAVGSATMLMLLAITWRTVG